MPGAFLAISKGQSYMAEAITEGVIVDITSGAFQLAPTKHDADRWIPFAAG
jgi:hypothetical protein